MLRLKKTEDFADKLAVEVYPHFFIRFILGGVVNFINALFETVKHTLVNIIYPASDFNRPFAGDNIFKNVHIAVVSHNPVVWIFVGHSREHT